MARVTDEELLQLVKDKGEEYWMSELKKARTSVLIYAAVFVVAVVTVLLRAQVAPEFLVSQPLLARALILLPWVMIMVATLYVGACQVKLLPFMNSKLLLHWLIISVFAVAACGGLLWFVMLAGSNSSAKRRINELVASLENSE